MRHLRMLLLCLPALLVFGCASILPGHDPIVVNAERTTQIALVTFDTFLKFEYDNRQMLSTVDPGIKKYADKLRVEAPKWLSSARTLTKTYKKNRTPENKFSLLTATAVLSAAINESQTYIKVGATQ